MAKIAPVQVKLIKMAQKQLGLSDEKYHGLLLEFGDMPIVKGRPSCKGLTYDEATKLIDHMKALGFEITEKKYDRTSKTPKALPAGRVARPVSRDQEGYIRWLSNRITWRKKNGLELFIRKLIGRDWPMYKEEANKVINVLKAMIERERGK